MKQSIKTKRELDRIHQRLIGLTKSVERLIGDIDRDKQKTKEVQ